MKIHIYTIYKKRELEANTQLYIKSCKSFGIEINIHNIFNKDIALAQKAAKENAKIAQQIYTKVFEKYLDKDSLLLDSQGYMYDSISFSNMLESFFNKDFIKMFIAGAYGFDIELLQKHKTISLSKLTLSHEIAKLVLLEQIYRGFSLIKKHPYHK